MSPDRFDTAGLRDATLVAWTASPARFREDANAEEDHAHGYYRDRVVVELAQNAADAAARAGTPGRLLLLLVVDDAAAPGAPAASLLAANTGTPLDAQGLTSLASLRASAKRSAVRADDDLRADDDVRVGDARTVGRFGVGFAAVRSVADRVTVASTSGTVHFSLPRTAELVAGLGNPDLVAEAARRGDRLPVLRLPWPGPATDPTRDPAAAAALTLLDDGWDTVVHLELRDDAARAAVRRQLDAVGDPLLLALPGLGSIEVRTPEQVRTVRDVSSRWVVATRTGVLPQGLLRDRPVEERDRDGWQITWAAPREGLSLAGVVHAPTPTEEPCTVPALLIGTFPLDPTRRHVAPGPLTDALVGLAGEVWADLLDACRGARGPEPADDDGGPGAAGSAAPDPLRLVPTGLPAGSLDAALHDAVLAVTRDVPLLTPAAGGPPLTPRDATVLDGPGADHPGAAAVLGAAWPNLVAPRYREVLGLLGVERTRVADVVETLPGDDPDRRLALYDVFADAGAATLEELATLPVRLADGRVVRGARGLLVADGVPEGLLDVLGRWGTRLVGPRDAHPLLLRLGAEPVDAAALARHPVLRQRVLDEDDEDPAPVLLGLVEQAPAGRPGPAWWGELPLPAEDGEPVPARGLVMPGSPASRWFDPRVLPPVAADVAQRWNQTLVRVGVRAGLTVERLAPDDDVGATGGEPPADPVSATPGDLLDAVLDGTLADHPAGGSLDGWDEYLDVLAAAGSRGRSAGGSTALAAVADLDAVRPDAWPEVLRALSTGRARDALVEPVHLAGARRPSYTAWWLRHRSGLGLGRPFALPADRPAGAAFGSVAVLSGLLGPVPDVLSGLDREVLRALGGITDPTDLDPDGWHELLDALPATGQPTDIAVAVALWHGLAHLASVTVEGGAGLDDPPLLDVRRLPALAPDAVVVAAEQAAVADPMWAQHPGTHPVMVVPTDLADDVARLLDLDLATDRVDGQVTSRGAAAPVPDAVLVVYPDAPAQWFEHEDLTVDGRRVDWWVDRSGVPHAATTAGLAAALAQLVGRQHRGRLERLLLGGGSDDVLRDVLLDLAGEEQW